MYSRYAVLAEGFVVAIVLLLVSWPAAAQQDYEPLFDHFNLRLEGSWVTISTEMRLDSEQLGRGAVLNFEDDLDLANSKVIPSLTFEWQIAHRHRVSVRWQDISRDSSAQALEEIRWGDEVIPAEADITLGFDLTQYFIDYAYFPWVKERWAAGFGLGIRWMDLAATLAWALQSAEGEGRTDAQGSGPLPYLYFEYRRLLSDHWRLRTGLGWLAVKVEDIDGSQLVGRADIEYLIGRRWAVGGALNFARVDVDWAGLENSEGENLYTGSIDMNVGDVSFFARVRF